MEEKVSLKESAYCSKLYNSIRVLLSISGNCLFLQLDEKELFEILTNRMKGVNEEFYLLAANAVTELEARHRYYDLKKVKEFIVTLIIGEHFQSLGLAYFFNKLCALEDKKEGEQAQIDKKVLDYFENQLYPKMFSIYFQYIDPYTARKSSIGITERTYYRLYSYLRVEKREKQLVEDLKIWFSYHNLDYFFQIYEKDSKIVIYLKDLN